MAAKTKTITVQVDERLAAEIEGTTVHNFGLRTRYRCERLPTPARRSGKPCTDAAKPITMGRRRDGYPSRRPTAIPRLTHGYPSPRPMVMDRGEG